MENKERELAGLPMENQKLESAGPPIENQKQELAEPLTENQEKESARLLTRSQEQDSTRFPTEEQELASLPTGNQGISWAAHGQRGPGVGQTDSSRASKCRHNKQSEFRSKFYFKEKEKLSGQRLARVKSRYRSKTGGKIQKDIRIPKSRSLNHREHKNSGKKAQHGA